MSRRRAIAAVGAFAVVVVALGPRAGVEERWVEPTLSADLDAHLARSEATVAGVRPGDAKGIVWLDPDEPSVTPLSLVYIHGFSADRHEVEPLVGQLARELEANVFFTRLSGHGRDGAALGAATAEAWLDDVAEAIAVGGYLGERVVLVGTSTGGTLALWGASREEARDRVAALVLISPNLGLRDPAAPLLLWPWGGVLAHMIVGAERCFEPKNQEHARHWTTCYPTRALLPMMATVDLARSLDAGAVSVPTMAVYSPDDVVVDPDATERVLARVLARAPHTYLVEASGDPEHHVLAGDILSPGTTDAVRARVLAFLEDAGLATR